MRYYPDFDIVYYYPEKSSDKVYDDKFMAQKKKKATSSEVISSSDGLLTDNAKALVREDRIRDNITIAYLVAGDFNDVANVVENKGGVLVSSSKCNIFMVQINMCKLIDINIIGHKFTWSGPIFHGGHTTYEILDMALCNDDWSLDFPEAQLKILTRVEFSDYHSILINLNKVKIINADKIFHFESAWVLRDKFHEEFEKAWRKKDSMMDNLRDVKEDIIYWKSKTFD